MLAKINWTPDHKKLRNFGVVFLVMFACFGGLLAWRFGNLDLLYILGGIGAIAAILCTLLPAVGIWIYRAWMGLAACMGFVMAPLFLALTYYLVFTPMGIILRITGRDSLQLRKPQTDSFWREVKMRSDKRSYERQF